DVAETFFTDYTTGDDIAASNVHPTGSLIKYTNNSAVYYIDNEEKRAIQTEQVFELNGFQKDHILTISEAVVYPDGALIIGQENAWVEVY
ncbi:hypothetical protein KKD84_01080, partial [Patescibacteria group bacterium]|nr:hypothetical protein [Patescibacteria group bacterium]